MLTARKLLAPLLAVTLITATLPARADVTKEEQDIAYLSDVGVVRPLGAIATVAGFALFLVTIPLAVITNSVEKSWNYLVVSPASHTLQRELGGEDYNNAYVQGPVSRPANE